jgi:tRNA A37 threonylcarbamoyladenosine modification protein TsaB
MELEIALNKVIITIKLIGDEKTIDQINLEERHNLSHVLLKSIDSLLNKNKLSKNQIKKVLVKSDLPDSYTSIHIAKCVAKAFNFALNSK